MRTPSRRFPAPWTVVETDRGYRVDDAKGQTIGWFYGEDEPSRRGCNEWPHAGRSQADGRQLRQTPRSVEKGPLNGF
jgi:hypothetical protein